MAHAYLPCTGCMQAGRPSSPPQHGYYEMSTWSCSPARSPPTPPCLPSFLDPQLSPAAYRAALSEALEHCSSIGEAEAKVRQGGALHGGGASGLRQARLVLCALALLAQPASNTASMCAMAGLYVRIESPMQACSNAMQDARSAAPHSTLLVHQCPPPFDCGAARRRSSATTALSWSPTWARTR